MGAAPIMNGTSAISWITIYYSESESGIWFYITVV
jgi:hypothetical protein